MVYSQNIKDFLGEIGESRNLILTFETNTKSKNKTKYFSSKNGAVVKGSAYITGGASRTVLEFLVCKDDHIEVEVIDEMFNDHSSSFLGTLLLPVESTEGRVIVLSEQELVQRALQLSRMEHAKSTTVKLTDILGLLEVCATSTLHQKCMVILKFQEYSMENPMNVERMQRGEYPITHKVGVTLKSASKGVTSIYLDMEVTITTREFFCNIKELFNRDIAAPINRKYKLGETWEQAVKEVVRIAKRQV